MKRVYLIGIAALCLSISAQAMNLNVYCGQKRFPNSITAALKLLNPQGPNTLTVYGTCKENVVIRGFNRLTLVTNTGATINDASGGTGFVVDIESSTNIEVQGFTINGGVLGVQCSLFSICSFDGNTVQGALAAGIQFVRSGGMFGANIVQNNANGLAVLESSSIRTFGGLVIQQNAGQGVMVSDSSFGTFGDTIQNNGGDGIGADNGSLLLLGTSLTGNSGQGVAVLGHSAATFVSDNVVTGNGYDGVLVRDLSYAQFSGPNTITGNSVLDVECQPQYPVTRGALTNIGGGNTNCTDSLATAAKSHFPSQLTKPTR